MEAKISSPAGTNSLCYEVTATGYKLCYKDANDVNITEIDLTPEELDKFILIGSTIKLCKTVMAVGNG